METLKVDGLVIEKSEFMGVAEARIEISKHLALHTKIEKMSMYWNEDDESYMLLTGIERASLFLEKAVAEEIAEFLNLTKWKYDEYDNVVVFKNGEH
ncbi:hypothetical protein L5M38_23375 [Shewanella sp. SM101]|uniref:hypothetical protein n=1 Tax=Shewanella sp. SM101 TaxID=2912789 RepID=UPI0021D8D2CD|nr:hypothetical protein [Shewanella sp. SM101]MCU8107435.1 hypothetical protein [Shewanella sp. SM101]